MSIISDQVPEGLLVQMVSWSGMERRIAELEQQLALADKEYCSDAREKDKLYTQLAELREAYQGESMRSSMLFDELAALKQHCQLLREVTKELADDVDDYADVERHGRFAYPHIMAKWERDMEPVNRARTLLKQWGE